MLKTAPRKLNFSIFRPWVKKWLNELLESQFVVSFPALAPEVVLGEAWQAEFVAICGKCALLVLLEAVLGDAWQTEFVAICGGCALLVLLEAVLDDA